MHQFSWEKGFFTFSTVGEFWNLTFYCSRVPNIIQNWGKIVIFTFNVNVFVSIIWWIPYIMESLAPKSINSINSRGKWPQSQRPGKRESSWQRISDHGSPRPLWTPTIYPWRCFISWNVRMPVRRFLRSIGVLPGNPSTGFPRPTTYHMTDHDPIFFNRFHFLLIEWLNFTLQWREILICRNLVILVFAIFVRIFF